jgi:hypothetical protein
MSVLLKAIAAMADIVPGWIWAAICAALVATSCTTGHQRDKARLSLAELKADVQEKEATRSEIARLAEAGRRQSERDLATALNTLERKKTDEIRRLQRDAADLRLSLLNRPERPAPGGGAVPADPAPAVGCTGAQLYRGDAQLLAGYAERAETVRQRLANCQAQYDAAVRAAAAPPSD